MSEDNREVLLALDRLLHHLSEPLSPVDAAYGWHEVTRLRWLKWMRETRATASEGEVPRVDLWLALDHNSIHGGRYGLEAGQLTEAVHGAAMALSKWKERRRLQQLRSAFEAAKDLTDIAWLLKTEELFASTWRNPPGFTVETLGTPRITSEDGLHNQLMPFDRRFTESNEAVSAPGSESYERLTAVGFVGPPFSVTPAQAAEALPLYDRGWNTYDGGRFFFFYPLQPNGGGLCGIQLWADDKDVVRGRRDADLASVCHVVNFMFGSKIRLLRDGYSCA